MEIVFLWPIEGVSGNIIGNVMKLQIVIFDYGSLNSLNKSQVNIMYLISLLPCSK